MDVMQAINTRRSVRKYIDKPVAKETVEQLIRAAILAPSAMNCQPWTFGIIEGADTLKGYSDRAKAFILENLDKFPILARYKDMLSNPASNLFYGASTLLVIYAKKVGPNPRVDCALAAENVMLAAWSMGLGTCWIGLSMLLLDSPEVKQELGVPDDYDIVAPIIIGYPDGEMPPTPHNEPEILFWK
jgi:nitroreductase